MSVLLAFEASARHLSFTKAAVELSLTQSAVSRQVQVLEELLEVELLYRRGRQLELTDVGRMYMREIGVAINRIRNATLQAIAQQSGGGSLHLALLPTFGTKWLMPRLHAFYGANPNVLIHLHSRIEEFDLEAAGMDAVIRVSQGPPPGLIAHPLLQEELILIASPEIQSRRPISSSKDLNGLLLLRVATRLNVWLEWFDEFNERPSTPHFGPTFELTSHLIQAVSTGIGVGLVPSCLVEEEVRSGHLCTPLGMQMKSGKTYYFCYPEHKKDYAPLVAFRNWLFNNEI